MDTTHLTAHITDQNTAERQLKSISQQLAHHVELSEAAARAMRAELLKVRPSGLLTVTEMAEAIGRDRNYVDSVWSSHGDTLKGKQTRVPVGDNAAAARAAYDSLSELAAEVKGTQDREKTVRAERDRLVALVYASKVLGPTDISRAVGIDRNHVLRIARRAGVKPMHRKVCHNQYTVPAQQSVPAQAEVQGDAA